PCRPACADSWPGLVPPSVLLRSFRGLLSHDGAHSGDGALGLLQLAGIGKLLRGDLHAQAELRPQQRLELLLQLLAALSSEFAHVHGSFPSVPACAVQRWCGMAAWPRRARTPPWRAPP